MSILAPMKPAAFTAYREMAIRNYAEDNVASGRWPSEGAIERSSEDFAESLPQGLDTPNNYLYEIQSNEHSEAVGILWFAVIVKNGIKSAFIYDVEIKPEYRRQGHGRAAFAALEPLVLDLGLSSIGLHVFGHNPSAKALYDSMGYGVTGISMLKRLGKSDA
jgi:ribosomal protein S18 acetylase RimI-like enzyme